MIYYPPNAVNSSQLSKSAGKFVKRLLGNGIGVLGCRILSALHLVSIGLDSTKTLAPDITVLLDELWQESAGREVSGHVDLHQDLAGAAITGADANGWDRELFRDKCCDFSGNSLDDHGESTGLLYGECILKEPQSPVGSLALHSEAAKSVLPLRCQSHVRENGDARGRDLLDCGGHLLATLELHALHATLFDEADGSFQSLFRSYFIAAHGQITHLSLDQYDICSLDPE